MSLLNFQTVLARLYLDPQIRESLRSGDSSTLSAYDLSEEELKSLQGLIRDRRTEFELFAGLLISKRSQKLERFYPLVKAYLKPEAWKNLASSYCFQVPPTSSLVLSSDALSFAQFVRESFVPTPEHELAFADLVNYESAKAKIAEAIETTGAQVVKARMTPEGEPAQACPCFIAPACLRVLNHDPQSLVNWARSGSRQPNAPPLSRTVLIFFRRGEDGATVGVSKAGPFLALLLARADGKTSLGEIIDDPPSSLKPPHALEEAWQALGRLEQSGIIGLHWKKERA